MFIKTLGNFNEKILQILKKEINKIIDLVKDYTYNSWQTLLNKLIAVTTDIVRRQKMSMRKEDYLLKRLLISKLAAKDNFTFLGMVEFDTSSMQITP